MQTAVESSGAVIELARRKAVANELLGRHGIGTSMAAAVLRFVVLDAGSEPGSRIETSYAELMLAVWTRPELTLGRPCGTSHSAARLAVDRLVREKLVDVERLEEPDRFVLVLRDAASPEFRLKADPQLSFSFAPHASDGPPANVVSPQVRLAQFEDGHAKDVCGGPGARDDGKQPACAVGLRNEAAQVRCAVVLREAQVENHPGDLAPRRTSNGLQPRGLQLGEASRPDRGGQLPRAAPTAPANRGPPRPHDHQERELQRIISHGESSHNHEAPRPAKLGESLGGVVIPDAVEVEDQVQRVARRIIEALPGFAEPIAVHVARHAVVVIEADGHADFTLARVDQVLAKTRGKDNPGAYAMTCFRGDFLARDWPWKWGKKVSFC